MSAGEFLRRTREEANLTQSELAALCDTQQAAISRIENDYVSPTVGMLERLVAACGRELRLAAEAVDA